MNNKNLIPVRTVNEAREKGKKGGIKSGQARRERKALKEQLLMMLESGDIQENICLALLKEAQNGNIKAFEVIRDTIGEKPIDKTAQTTADGKDLNPPIVSSAELLAIMERRNRERERYNS